jgi:hypothetical protein
MSEHVTVAWPLQQMALRGRAGGRSCRESRTTIVYSPQKPGGNRRTVGGLWPFVDSRLRSSRHAWHVVSSAQRGVSHATICWGFIALSVGQHYASRWGPGPSWTSTQRTPTSASPIRYQRPVPVTTSMARGLPPSQATVRRVRCAVCATTACGDASCWPFPRGRPMVRRVRGGGGAYKAAAPEHVRTPVRCWRC